MIANNQQLEAGSNSPREIQHQTPPKRPLNDHAHLPTAPPATYKRTNPEQITKNKYSGCNCTKSLCLKMYCACFSVGKICDETCLCQSCKNKQDDMDRAEVIHEIANKDPMAFSRKGTFLEVIDSLCNCRKSACLKKYCDCFKGGKTCGKSCQCIGCSNRESQQQLEGSFPDSPSQQSDHYMGNSCQCCEVVQDADQKELNLNATSQYLIEPADFYNPLTRQIAKRLGPFQIHDEEVQGLVTKGPIQMENGVRYCGQFNNGMRNGRGKQVWPDFTIYEGFWEDDLQSGRGRLISSNGDVYQGEWKDSKFSGKGVLTSADGSTYTGQWLDNSQHGFGIQKFVDGSNYEGQFYEGKKHGNGKFEWPDHSYYQGSFVHNQMWGKGRFVSSDEKQYNGEWRDNKKQGKGVFKWPDGKIYQGDFLNDKKHGHGKLTWPDGRYYDGEWRDGQQHGKGCYFGQEGVPKYCQWQNGKRIN